MVCDRRKQDTLLWRYWQPCSRYGEARKVAAVANLGCCTRPIRIFRCPTRPTARYPAIDVFIAMILLHYTCTPLLYFHTSSSNELLFASQHQKSARACLPELPAMPAHGTRLGLPFSPLSLISGSDRYRIVSKVRVCLLPVPKSS